MAPDEQVLDGRRPGAIGTGLKVVLQSSPLGFVALVAAAVARGLVPAAAGVLCGRAVGAIDGAVAAGGLHGQGRDLAVAVVAIAVLYGADQVAESLLFPVTEGWSMAIKARVEQRAMRALLGPPLLDHLLDADIRRTADVAMREEWPHPGTFATSFLNAVTWLVGAGGLAVLVARFSPLLAVATAAAWLAIGAWVRRQELVGVLSAVEMLRRPDYERHFTMDQNSAGEIRTFGLGPWLVERYDRGASAAMAAAWKRRAATARTLVPLVGVLVAGNVAGIAFLATAARDGQLSPARLAVVVSAFVGLAQLALPQQWTEGLLWGATRLPALVELEAVAAQETRRVTPARAVEPTGLPQVSIAFEGVTFAYPGRDEPVLAGIDLEIAAGTSLAIVGENGAGKTTLVRLLARLHDPVSGRITVDGVDLRHLDPVAWQRRVAAVFQDSVRYPFDVAETVALRAVPREQWHRLDDAAAAAGAAAVVDALPARWDTVLSRRYAGGLDVSGGQWQRIALTRAVFALHAGAGVLLLDEPTANLDARAETELYDRFVDVAKGATTILVSHRFSTVRRADRIVVLDAGRIVEDGTHDDLVAAGGRYARLFRLQADRYGEDVVA